MDTGGKIRTGNILKQLSNQHDITLISNMESPKEDEWLPQIPLFCSKFIPVKWKEIKKYSLLFFLRLFVQMFSIYPVSVLNDYSRQLRLAVEKELTQGKYDIAICDFVQSALIFRDVKGIATLLFQHNVESMIARRHVDQNSHWIGKFFWWLQWRKMAFFEKKACQKFDTVIAVSENDKNTFMELYKVNNVRTIPTGVDVEYYSPSPLPPSLPPSLSFCGSMDWLPNEDAVLFFMREILPEVAKEIPGIRLIVVGRNPSSALKKSVLDFPGVTLTGWVDDTRSYIAESFLFVVPIRIGGGTRMKIFEAMAMGKAVISTTIGAEGLPVTHEKNIMIADEPLLFAKEIINLIHSSSQRESLEFNAREYVVKHFAWEAVATVFSDVCCNTCFNKNDLRDNR